MYSASNEEAIILDYFKDSKGRYLDIGAFDGVTCSNTLALAELGWEGVAIEPSPLNFAKLKKNYADRKLSAIELINAAYVPDSFKGIVSFYDIFNGTQLGSITKNNILTRSEVKNETIKMCQVPTIKPKELFNNPDYSFISIDTERTNLEAMVTIPWHLCEKLELVCIEVDTDGSRFEDFMENVNYTLLQYVKPNMFFIKK